MCINYYLTLNKRFYVCHQVSEYSELISNTTEKLSFVVQVCDPVTMI